MKNFYVYPAVFEKENQYFNVWFPDLPGCLTYGVGAKEALLMAEDASAGWLEVNEEGYADNPPVPSSIETITIPENGFVSLVHAMYHQPEELGFEAADLDDEFDDSDFEIPEGTARAILKFAGIDCSEEEEGHDFEDEQDLNQNAHLVFHA